MVWAALATQVIGCGVSPGPTGSGAASARSSASLASARSILSDPSGARSLDREACRRGEGPACERVGQTYRRGLHPSDSAAREDSDLFRRQCEEREVAGACVALGWMLTPGEETRAIALFIRACTGGSALGCASLAEAHEAGAGVPKSDAHAARLYKGACELGLAEACASAAGMLDTGRGLPADPRAAVLHYSKACDGGVADACAALAIATALGNGTARDESLAASLFQKGCAAGSARACTGLGIAYAYGRGVAKEEARAADLLRKPCAAGDALSCRELAQILTSAPPPTRSDSEGLGLYSRACAEGDAAACASAGSLIAGGRGAAADATRAASLWTRACNAGNVAGCTRLGIAYMKGRGVARDADKAALFLDKACKGGSASACNVLAIAYAFGDGVQRDNAKAEILFRAACEQGSATGCSRLGLCYQGRRLGAATYDLGIGQAAADCRRTALACEWLGAVPREQAEDALRLLVQACDAEVPAACSSLARAIAGARVPKSAAVVLMEEIRGHCKKGKAVWCRRLAFWHEEGLSVPKSEALARDFYKRACDGGDARACSDLGRMLATGQGGAKDIDGAIAVLRRACDIGSDGASACGHLGMIYINDGKLADRAAGALLLERACSQSDGLACDRLGGFFAIGAKGFAKDEKRATDLLERACALGGYACDEARRLRERFGIEDLR